MNRKRIFAFMLSISLCVSMVFPSHANNLMKAMEDISRRAVAAAIKEGTVPPDTTIYDCAYGKGADGVTRVVQYKNKSGNWIDVTTGKPAENAPANGTAASRLDEEELAEYADEVFHLVNQERREAGLDEVVWDDDFAACAQIRAEELTVKYSHERPEPVNDGIDWPQNVSGIGTYNAPSVADEQGVPHTWVMENIAITRGTPEVVVKAWMDSSGHRKNILREGHIRCGVGVSQPTEALYWSLWFDDYTES